MTRKNMGTMQAYFERKKKMQHKGIPKNASAGMHNMDKSYTIPAYQFISPDPCHASFRMLHA
jgi:hypothetical protein